MTMEHSMATTDNQTVYVVHNGGGGLINSVWTDESLADDRAGALNKTAQYVLAYSVTPTSLVA